MMSQSPSSVDAMCTSWPLPIPQQRHKKEYHPSHPNNWSFSGGEESDEEVEQLSEAWNSPSHQEMNRRHALRRRIREETLLNRRIHRHGGIIGGRNIALVLQQREAYGSAAGTVYHGIHPGRNVQLPEDFKHSSASTKGTQALTADPQSGSSTVMTPPPSNTTTTITRRSASPPSRSSQTDYRPTTSPTSIPPVPWSLTQEIRTFAEYSSVVRYHSAFLTHLGGQDDLLINGQRPASSPAVSTISVAFSPDAKTMASTHGDHSVKITTCGSGHLLETLIGHPRTPWTVKYHPSDPNIVASGCLGHQVRLWNWATATCLHMIRLEHAIISLSFHPKGQVLAIANGPRLHFWSLEGLLDDSSGNGNSNVDQPVSSTTQQVHPELDTSPQQHSIQQRRGALTEIDQRHMLRCVHFPPDGKSVIVGGVNQPVDRTSRRPNQMSFYLRLFDFDLEVARRPHDLSQTKDVHGKRRKIINNPKTFVPRALLYNDGGFDVSPDGKTLCCCAEYWLPDGVDNAIDAVYPNGPNESWSDSDDNVDDNCDEKNTDADNATQATSTPESSNVVPSSSDVDPSGNALDSPPRSGNTPPVQHSDMPPQAMSISRNFPLTPQTPPPSAILPPSALSPPSPPGRRFAGGLSRRHPRDQGIPLHGGSRPIAERHNSERSAQSGQGAATYDHQAVGSTFFPPPPPRGDIQRRTPVDGHESFHVMTRGLDGSNGASGRFVPHVVTISLDTAPLENDRESATGSPTGPSPISRSRHRRPRLGQLLEACPLDGAKASAVTCVKFSPSTDFCLIGYGVREPLLEHNGNQYHPVTALYRIRGGMAHVSTMLSSDDDVNIARFHPESGYGFVYGTKQGRVRVQSPRPWNFYDS